MLRSVVLCAALAGCATVATTGVHRAPALGARALPGPAVVWQVSSCLSSGESTGKSGELPELDTLLAAELGAPFHAIPKSDEVCASLAPDPVFLDDALRGPRWEVRLPPVLAAEPAGTVWVPVRRVHSACKTRDPFFRDTDPALPLREVRAECGDDQRQDVGLFAFEASTGRLLWKGTATSLDGSPGSLVTLFRGLTQQAVSAQDAPP